MKTNRERYREQFTYQPAANGKRGTRVYNGTWYFWDLESKRLHVLRIVSGILSPLSLGLLILCAVQNVEANRDSFVGILSMLAIAAAFAEAIGVARFVLHRSHMTEMDKQDIRRFCLAGAFFQCAFALVAAIGALAIAFHATENDWVCGGYFVAALCSFAVLQLLRKVPIGEEIAQDAGNADEPLYSADGSPL